MDFADYLMGIGSAMVISGIALAYCGNLHLSNIWMTAGGVTLVILGSIIAELGWYEQDLSVNPEKVNTAAAPYLQYLKNDDKNKKN